jgi:hypothetical protein
MSDRMLQPSAGAIAIWTRWYPRPKQKPAGGADALVHEACRFACDAAGGSPGLVFMLRTPGNPASDDVERAAGRCAVERGREGSGERGAGWDDPRISVPAAEPAGNIVLGSGIVAEPLVASEPAGSIC